MGTNYYLVKNGPTVNEPIHIGKSSMGWLFCFQSQKETWHEPPIVWNTYNQVKDTLKRLTNEGYDVGYWAGRRDYEPKWIPVTERLPEVFQHVLANIPGMSPHPTVQEAFREKNGMWYSNGFRYGADEITHWMPLPIAPMEE